jgi:exosome complex component RRP42
MQAEISDAEKAYIAQGVAQDLRNDGRGCRDCRPLELELGVVAQANGSARLHVGGTDVMVGVKVRAGSGGRRPRSGSGSGDGATPACCW